MFKDAQELSLKMYKIQDARLIVLCMDENSCKNAMELIEKIRTDNYFYKIPILTIYDYKKEFENNEFELFYKSEDLILKPSVNNMDFLIKVKSLVRRSEFFLIKGKLYLHQIEKDIFLYMYKKAGQLVTT